MDEPDVCAFGTAWPAHFAPLIGTGAGCAACDAETARLEAAFAADVAAGTFDDEGFTPADRRQQKARRTVTPATAVAEPAAFTGLDTKFELLPIEQLRESPFNPRKTFDAGKLAELAASVREKGVVEPIVVRAWSKHTTGTLFEIVCGARRYRAAKLAGLTHLPAVIREYTDVQVVEIMAIENGQRDDVPPLEEAAGYKALLGLATGYTAALIAEKIGRTEKFVWNRLRLLELVPEVQALLTSGEIGVEHAEVIAKLKPAEQRKLLKGHDSLQGTRGLWTWDGALAFDDNPEAKRQRKAVSVRELKQYIAEHVRLDLQHAAAAAPLDFGETARKVEQAEAQPGRGKKVIPITFSHYCPDGAKSEDERTYGATAWKKAEGKDGQPTCEHAKLGVVVAGEHYGESFHVCIARDRCTTHWKAEVAAKEKAAKLRESGKNKQAAKVEKKAEESWEAKRRREDAERKAREQAWKAIAEPVIAEAVNQVKSAKALTPKLAEALLGAFDCSGLSKPMLTKYLGVKWYEKPVAALLVSAVADFHYSAWVGKTSGFDDYVKEIAKPFGLDIKRLQAVREKHQAAAAPAPKAKAS